MPDWKKIVREKLGSLPLANRRKDEVVEELAQQLESAYEEALAQGINEQEALRRSLAQFKDWEKLRGEVFQSVEGTRLPVWEQNGVFSPRRWPVWAALALSLFFLAFPAFRQALAILPVPGTYSPLRNSVISGRTLRRLEQSGDKQKYARALAFVALYSPKEDDLIAMHAAEKAIALDPQLTWISAKVSHATYMIPGYDPHPWVERLKAWDPENAFPYILEADANVHSEWESRWAKFNGATPALREALAAEPRWRIPMEKAFAAPRIDSYNAQAFALDRQVLQENGFDRPDMLLSAAWSQPIPDLLAIKLYSEFSLKDVGEAAEKNGRIDDALAAYWLVASFGQKLQSEPESRFQNLVAMRLRQDAFEKILPLLRRQGRTLEAATVEASLTVLASNDPAKKKWLSSAQETAAKRSAGVVVFSGLFVVVLGFATVVWLLAVLTLRWGSHRSRSLNRVASLLSFAPPLLPLSCSALLLGYFPFALSVSQFASPGELRENFGPFLMYLYGFTSIGPISDVWITNMFWPLVWCAAIALAGAVVLKFVARRQRPDDTRAA